MFVHKFSYWKSIPLLPLGGKAPASLSPPQRLPAGKTGWWSLTHHWARSLGGPGYLETVAVILMVGATFGQRGMHAPRTRGFCFPGCPQGGQFSRGKSSYGWQEGEDSDSVSAAFSSRAPSWYSLRCWELFVEWMNEAEGSKMFTTQCHHTRKSITLIPSTAHETEGARCALEALMSPHLPDVPVPLRSCSSGLAHGQSRRPCADSLLSRAASPPGWLQAVWVPSLHTSSHLLRWSPQGSTSLSPPCREDRRWTGVQGMWHPPGEMGAV